MDAAGYIHKRKGKYMAQVLEAFEEHIEPLLPPGSEKARDDYKALTRARMNALAVDSVDILSLDGVAELNGAGQELRDSISPTGRP